MIFPITRHRRFAARMAAGWRSSTTLAFAEPVFLSLRSPLRWYSKKLDTHPILTKCASAAFIASIGNVTAQKITYTRQQKFEEVESKGQFQLDWGSVGRFAFLNAAYVAPVLHHWYQFVNKTFPGSSLKAVWTRVFYDEFVFTPMYLPVFMGALWRMEGTEWKRVQQMLVDEMPSIIVAEWVLWVPTMAITFRYAPVKYQVLVINLVGVVWQTFLSLVANRAQTGHEFCDSKKNHHKTPIKTLLPDTAVEDVLLFDFFEFNDEWMKQKLR